MKKIVIVGDSFTYGHGCSDREFYHDPATRRWVGNISLLQDNPSEYCWAALLQKMYPKYEVINLSKPANDNSYMMKKAYENVDESTALFIYAGTMTARMHVTSNTPMGPVPWVMSTEDTNAPQQLRNAKEQFIKYLYNDDVFSLISLNALYAAYGLSQKYNCKFIWSAPTFDDPMYEQQANILDEMKMTTAIYYRDKEPSMRATDNHLNSLGHAHYFTEVVLPKIKQTLEQL